MTCPDLIIIDGERDSFLSFPGTSEIEAQDSYNLHSQAGRRNLCTWNQIPLPTKERRESLLLCPGNPDEAHRFAITYNRLLSKKS